MFFPIVCVFINLFRKLMTPRDFDAYHEEQKKSNVPGQGMCHLTIHLNVRRRRRRRRRVTQYLGHNFHPPAPGDLNVGVDSDGFWTIPLKKDKERESRGGFHVTIRVCYQVLT